MLLTLVKDANFLFKIQVNILLKTLPSDIHQKLSARLVLTKEFTAGSSRLAF